MKALPGSTLSWAVSIIFPNLDNLLAMSQSLQVYFAQISSNKQFHPQVDVLEMPGQGVHAASIMEKLVPLATHYLPTRSCCERRSEVIHVSHLWATSRNLAWPLSILLRRPNPLCMGATGSRSSPYSPFGRACGGDSSPIMVVDAHSTLPGNPQTLYLLHRKQADLLRPQPDERVPGVLPLHS